MVRLGVALAVLLASANLQNKNAADAFHNFQPNSLSHVREKVVSQQRRAEPNVQRRVASSSSNPEFNNNNQNGEIIGEAFNAARDSIANAVRDEPDTDEEMIALRQQRVQERTKTYTVTLPLVKSSFIEEKSQVLSMGMSACQVNKGREFEGLELDLDSLEFLKTDAIQEEEGVERLDEVSLSRRITGEFQGLVVSSVTKDGAAWAAGVRPGDIIKSTSATMGSQRWPKSSLEGVRSVLQSRKAVSTSIQFELQRPGEAVDNQFELTLTRPIGLELKESEDGYVEVTGFTDSASTLVQYAVKVGDRVLAVDSSLGDRMWPVSTVEGVISAVTSRLPGQQITFRFERPLDLNTPMSDEPVTIRSRKVTAATGAAPAVEQEELLRRCREVIKRYTVADEPTKEKFVNKYAVPGLVADKVVDALASAGTKVDAVTLSMIMCAYLSCRQPQKAIEVFEAAVGIHASGSDAKATVVIKGKNDALLAPNVVALDNYTASALLKAHAMNGDLSSVRRVLAALGGRDDSTVDGLKVGSWPGTGPEGSLQPNTMCYNIAISALADSKTENSLYLAMQIFDSMTEPGRNGGVAPSKSLVTYNVIINALTSRRRFEEAIDVFYGMKRVGITPDKFSYTSLVKAIVAMSEGDLEEFFYDMKEQGVSPDPILFNTVIKSLCEQKKIVAAKKVIVQMESSGVAPDSMTYGLLMKGLLDTGNPSAALTLFETACSDRRTVALTENVYLYTTAISAAAAVADHERALELLARMNGLGISPNLKTMTALVGACLASGMPDLAYDIYKRISKPDGYAMLQGIQALCGFRKVKEAFEILRSKESRAMSGKQRMFAYKSMMESTLERGDYDMARDVFGDILRTGAIPSKAIYESIFETLKLFPSRKNTGGLPPVVHLDKESSSKFQFLLFVLDSIMARNLPCEGPLYSAILSYGSQLGSLPRKLATLMVSARATDIASTKEIVQRSEVEITRVSSSWEELFLRYDELKSQLRGDEPSSLPPVSVRVNSRDMPKVLRSEKSLSYAKRKPRRQEI